MRGMHDSTTAGGGGHVPRRSPSWRRLEVEARDVATCPSELCEHVFATAVLRQAPVRQPSYDSAVRDRTLEWIRDERRLVASAGIGATLVPMPLPAARRTLTGWSLTGRSRALLTDATDVLVLAAREEQETVGLFVLPLEQAPELLRMPAGDATQLELRGVRVSPYGRIGSFDRDGVDRLGRLASRLRREIDRALRSCRETGETGETGASGG